MFFTHLLEAALSGLKNFTAEELLVIALLKVAHVHWEARRENMHKLQSGIEEGEKKQTLP